MAYATISIYNGFIILSNKMSRYMARCIGGGINTIRGLVVSEVGRG